MKKTKKKKTLLFSLGLAFMMLTANNMNAQNGGGVFGKGSKPETEQHRGWLGSGQQSGFNLNNQTFGSDANGGYQLSNQTFGQESPLGGGLAIFLVAGVGYAAMKSRKKNQKSNK